MRLISILIFLLFSGGLMAQQNVAIIVEEHSDRFNFIFYCKVAVMLVLGVLGILSYIKYHRQEKASK